MNEEQQHAQASRKMVVVVAPGRMEMIWGPMYAGKTSELFRRIRRLRAAKKECVIVQHSSDVRYDSDEDEEESKQVAKNTATVKKKFILTHDREKMNACRFGSLKEARDSFVERGEDWKYIAVDEGHFFPDLLEMCDYWVNRGVHVLVTALSSDFMRRPFKQVSKLSANVESLLLLTAVCFICGEEAPFTYRLGRETETVIVGRMNMYEARCRRCHMAGSFGAAKTTSESSTNE